VDFLVEPDHSAGRRAGLEEAIRQAIRTGRLGAQARLPSTRTLARELGVARGTVIAAYDQLAAEGYLVPRQGSGTTVANVPPLPVAGLTAAAPAAVARHDLRPGRPDLSAFPATAWLRATRRALARAPAEALALSEPAGRIELRTALASYLGRARGVLASPERIVITSGYAQALGLLAWVLHDAGVPAIAMEDPGHPFHRRLVRRAGLAILALPVDDRGSRTDLLASPDFRAAGAVVLTPAHQYPAGATLPPERRRALTRWAQSTGGLVIEDDYDGEYRYDRQPVGAVQGMAPQSVAYAGTASKTLAPGLRLAWMVLPDRLIGPVTEAKRYADAHTGSLGQLTLAELITSHGYDRQVRASRLRYRNRRDLLLTRLSQHAPRAAVRGVAAGLHALIELPAGGPGEAEIQARAAGHGLALQLLAGHWHHPGDHSPGIIVGYSTPAEREYTAALDALCATLAP
jgi:GntR family transcriptional regulator/MocR family aminotransferase